MSNDTLLTISYWFSVILSWLLLLVSAMAVGKHIADLQYQYARRINGVRRIQSWINVRTHANRVWFAIAFIGTSAAGLFVDDPIIRVWVGRVLFIAVLLAYTLSAILDWMAENKQLNLLLEAEVQTKFPEVRFNLHRLNNQLAIYFGYTEETNNVNKKELMEVQEEIIKIVKSIQYDIRSMDASYVEVHKI